MTTHQIQGYAIFQQKMTHMYTVDRKEGVGKLIYVHNQVNLAMATGVFVVPQLATSSSAEDLLKGFSQNSLQNISRCWGVLLKTDV